MIEIVSDYRAYVIPIQPNVFVFDPIQQEEFKLENENNKLL